MLPTMTKVALFTSKGCKHCKRAKQILQEKNVRYREYQENRKQTLLKAIRTYTGKRTVPQIFIAKQFIGGREELESLIDTGEFIQLLQGSPERSALPDEVEQIIAHNLDDEDDVGIAEGEGTSSQVDWKRYQELEASVAAVGKQYSISAGQAVSGEQVALALSKHSSGQDAITLGQELLDNRLLIENPNDIAFIGKFVNDKNKKYYFPARLESTVFNGHMLWPRKARAASMVAEDLRMKILNLYEKFLSPDGNAVDYEGLSRSEEFENYIRATSELRDVDLTALNRDEKIAFFINVYNALIVHATAAIGAPDSLIKRLKFFSTISYCIGGQVYSCDDMEHGILRGNKHSPGSILAVIGLGNFAKPIFRKGDPRRAFVVSPMDPRIHFALVCGAKSCPPIRLYSASNLEDGLAGAAEAFCESEVQVDEETKTVTMSKILSWYGKDFAPNKVELLRKVLEFAPNDKLKNLLEKYPNQIKCTYAAYDWSVNKA